MRGMWGSRGVAFRYACDWMAVDATRFTAIPLCQQRTFMAGEEESSQKNKCLERWQLQHISAECLLAAKAKTFIITIIHHSTVAISTLIFNHLESLVRHTQQHTIDTIAHAPPSAETQQFAEDSNLKIPQKRRYMPEVRKKCSIKIAGLEWWTHLGRAEFRTTIMIWSFFAEARSGSRAIRTMTMMRKFSFSCTQLVSLAEMFNKINRLRWCEHIIIVITIYRATRHAELWCNLFWYSINNPKEIRKARRSIFFCDLISSADDGCGCPASHTHIHSHKWCIIYEITLSVKCHGTATTAPANVEQ
jgi:hypothetical protein